IRDLTQAASELAGLINSPNEFYDQIKNAAIRVSRAGQELRTAFSNNAASTAIEDVTRLLEQGDTKFDDPDSFPMRMRLMEIEDLAAQSEWEARQSRRQTTTYYPEFDTDIWSIAAELGQNPEELSALNQGRF